MAKAQMAGKLLQYLTKGLRGADGAIDMGQVGIRVVPDAVFGGLAAVQTSMALDTAVSLGGDMLAYQAGEQLMRAKDKLSGGKGRTPYERMGDQERAIYEEQLRRQIMAQYGLLPGSREQYAGMG